MTVVVGHMGHVLSRVAEKLESLAVDWSEGFRGDWYKHYVCDI